MSDTLEYIDLYFTGNLSVTEKTEFEIRCESDPAFAEEVAFYISARSELKNIALDVKRQEFNDLYTSLSAKKSPKGILRNLYPALVAAAACLILFVGWQLFFKNNLSREQQAAQLANQYIEKNIKNLGITMGGGDKDSLQLGIAKFNKKNYKEAEKIFLGLSAEKNKNTEAIKYLGLLYLVTEDFEKAIVQFDKLAQHTELYANPGLFYKAVTLMKRSSNGDVANAKTILREVIEKDLPGNKEAKTWIDKM